MFIRKTLCPPTVADSPSAGGIRVSRREGCGETGNFQSESPILCISGCNMWTTCGIWLRIKAGCLGWLGLRVTMTRLTFYGWAELPSPLSLLLISVAHLNCDLGSIYTGAPGLMVAARGTHRGLGAWFPQEWMSATEQTKMLRLFSSASEAWVLMWPSIMTALVPGCKICWKKVHSSLSSFSLLPAPLLVWGRHLHMQEGNVSAWEALPSSGWLRTCLWGTCLSGNLDLPLKRWKRLTSQQEK